MDDGALRKAVEAALREAAAEAAARRPAKISAKAAQDYVTDVDHHVDAHLTARLGALTPDAPVLSEERATTPGAVRPPYWILDPIDGTLNLAAGLPFVGVSAALVDAEGPWLGVVASLHGDGAVWSALRGGGAWRDGARLAAPARPPEIVLLSTGTLDHLATRPAAYRALRGVGKVRNLGAQALHLCLAASGAAAAALSREARVWDEAAGALIAAEAGCVLRAWGGAVDWSRSDAAMAAPGRRSLVAHPAIAAEIAGPAATALEGDDA